MIRTFNAIDGIKDDYNSNHTSGNEAIGVIGIGGGGSNAVAYMIESGISEDIRYMVANTDAQVLAESICENKIRLGLGVTKGLGAGGDPSIGIEAAEESSADLRKEIEGLSLLFIVAGMGGGTGTGASQVVAQIAKECGVLTMAIITRPFLFEGIQKRNIADYGIESLARYVDTYTVVDNNKLFNIIDPKTSMVDAFKIADEVALLGVRSISNLVSSSGLINLDFNDIKAVIEGMGRTVIGVSEASGDDRAEKLLKSITANDLLDDYTIFDAKKILINITGGLDLTLYDVNIIVGGVRDKCSDDVLISFGANIDPSIKDIARVTTIATGIEIDGSVNLVNKKQDAEPLKSSYTAPAAKVNEVKKDPKVRKSAPAAKLPEQNLFAMIHNNTNSKISNNETKTEKSVKQKEAIIEIPSFLKNKK